MSNNILFQAATRGGKYGVTVERHNENQDCLIFIETTSGRPCGSGGSTNHAYITRRIAMMIQDAKLIDGINYIISKDEIGVKDELNLIDSNQLYPVARLREVSGPQNS